MNLDKIFDLLHCDIDVLEGIKNCDNSIDDYEEILTSFVSNSAFSVLKEMVSIMDHTNSIRIARLLYSCSKKLGMTYLSDCLHDLLGCIQSAKWELANHFTEKILSHISNIKATLQQYEMSALFC